MLTDSNVIIRNARFHAYHGVAEQERVVGNDYEVSVQVDCDITRAIETDNLDGTVNYADVYQLVAEEMQTPSRLLEHVAGRICQRLFETFPTIWWITLEIIKKNPPMGADCDGAGVRITMENDKRENG